MSESTLAEMRINETFANGNPKEIEYTVGDTTLVQTLKEDGIITRKLTFIHDSLYEKKLSDDDGNLFLYEKFDYSEGEDDVRYRIEFSKSGDTLAYGFMKNEETYFGKWTQLKKPNFKIVSIIGKNGEIPDSSTIYFDNKFYRKIGTNQVDDPEIYKNK